MKEKDLQQEILDDILNDVKELQKEILDEVTTDILNDVKELTLNE